MSILRGMIGWLSRWTSPTDPPAVVISIIGSDRGVFSVSGSEYGRRIDASDRSFVAVAGSERGRAIEGSDASVVAIEGS